MRRKFEIFSLMMVGFVTSACAGSVNIRGRAPGAGGGVGAQARVRVDSSFAGAVASLLETPGALGESSFSTKIEPPRARGVVEVGPDGLARMPDFGSVEASGGAVSTSELSGGEAAFGHASAASSGSGDAPERATASGTSGSAGRGVGRLAGGGVATVAGGATGRRAGNVRGELQVPDGFALIDLLRGGVMVGSVPVSLSEIQPLSSFGFGSPGAWSAEQDATVALLSDGPVRAFAAIDGSGEAAEGEVELVVGLRGDVEGAEPQGRRRIHLVLDASESMEAIWPEILSAARGLIRSLGSQDVVQIVVYGSTARELLPPTVVGGGEAAATALSGVDVGGYTNIEAGLELAYDAVARGRAEAPTDDVMVILMSDGVPNVGAFGASAVGQLAERARQRWGCTTAAVGLGGAFAADVLRAIAREGRGGYYVAPTAAELLPALSAEVSARQQVAARDLSLEVDPASGVQILDVRDGDGGANITHGQLQMSLPSLHVSEERQLVIRLDLSAAALGSPLASVSIGVGGARVARRQVRLGARPSAAAALAVADAHLSAALDRAKDRLRDNDGAAAAEALREHCRSVRRRHGARLPAELSGRTVRVERLAAVLAQRGTGAPDEDRFAVARALGGLAVRLGR